MEEMEDAIEASVVAALRALDSEWELVGVRDSA